MLELRNAARAAAAFLLALSLTSQTATAAPTDGEESESVEAVAPDRKKELHCLATAIYHEARGEPERGQLVVGRVILNRVASAYYPDTICDVVYQNVHMRNACQFSFACDGVKRRVTEKQIWNDIEQRAQWLMNCLGDNDCEETKRHSSIWSSTHYHADYVHPFWADKIARMGQVGRHIFYYTATM